VSMISRNHAIVLKVGIFLSFQMIRVCLFKYLGIGMQAFDWNSDNVSSC
jgi:hypothetical protein